jgi:hypothetical protein
MDEKTFLIIQRIANEHSSKTFGYLTSDDLKNEIWAICLDKIKDFDYSRGELEHFLRVSVKNRLVNRFKDITKSVRSPCPRCPYYNPKNKESDCTKFFENKHECNKWRNYQLSIESRNSLLNATEQQGDRVTGDTALNRIISDEIKELVISEIDDAYHHDLQQLMSGGKISKQRLKRLKREIIRILTMKNIDDPDLIQINIKRKKK